MVLCLKTRESRSPPVLLIAICSSLYALILSSHFLSKCFFYLIPIRVFCNSSKIVAGDNTQAKNNLQIFEKSHNLSSDEEVRLGVETHFKNVSLCGHKKHSFRRRLEGGKIVFLFRDIICRAMSFLIVSNFQSPLSGDIFCLNK